MIIFLILGVLAINSIYAIDFADDSDLPRYVAPVYVNEIADDSDLPRYVAPVYSSDSSDNTTIEDANAENILLQENMTNSNNNLSMEVNNIQTSQNNIQTSQNNSQIIENNTQHNNSIINAMPNTANPLFVLLIACILIPMGIYRKRK